ncbi:MAG TPA: hypothetical protein VFF06_04855 [Polyangia bacterium]|nr:hypothetical protein [Polyangia bacterium]
MKLLRAAIVGWACLAPLAASAGDVPWWHDPARGCGTKEDWKRTHRIKDLPGCDGELPKGAPPAEVAMHDAKLALGRAEKALDDGRPALVEPAIADATRFMNEAPRNDPRANWARAIYAEAIQILRDRLAPPPK